MYFYKHPYPPLPNPWSYTPGVDLGKEVGAGAYSGRGFGGHDPYPFWEIFAI